MADLYQITTNGGVTFYFSGAQISLPWAGNIYNAGPGYPVWSRGKVTSKLGVEVATLDVVLSSMLTDTVDGVPWVEFVLGLGLDSATLTLLRAFLPAWQGFPPYTITGTLIDFEGPITQIKDISDTQMTLTVSSQLVRANVSMGPDVFQAPCLNTLFDPSCTLSKASFTTTGAVGGSGMTTTSFDTGLTAADGYYTQGQMTFTSGANNGLQRSIKSYANASGAVKLVLPLPAAPALGDTFNISAGCDLTSPTCLAKFSNLIHFRGQPYTPPPITGFLGA